jgi:methyl-accepting chemotaxis protein
MPISLAGSLSKARIDLPLRAAGRSFWNRQAANNAAAGEAMKISTKLTLFYVAMLTVFCALTGTLLWQLRVLSSGYDRVLSGPVREINDARRVQVDFKKQVQEWKDILLRGHNQDDLAKYTMQFHDRELQVRAGAVALAGETQDPEVRQLLQDFLQAHQTLSQKYQLAYAAYSGGNFDFKAADAIVRGQDRAPTDLFDKAVERLSRRVQESVESQRWSAQRNRASPLPLRLDRSCFWAWLACG